MASHVAYWFIFTVQVNLPGSPSAAATLASYAAHQFASMDQQVTAVQGINALAVACGAFTAERIAFASCLPLAPGGGCLRECLVVPINAGQLLVLLGPALVSASCFMPAGRRLLEGAHACLIQAFELPQARAYPKAFAAAAQLLCTALLAAHPSLLMVLLEPDAPDVYQPQGTAGRGGKVGHVAAEGVWAERGAPQAQQDCSCVP